MESITSPTTLSIAILQHAHGFSIGLAFLHPDTKKIEIGRFEEISDKFPFLESTLLCLSPDRLVISGSSLETVTALATQTIPGSEMSRVAHEASMETDVSRLAKNPHSAGDFCKASSAALGGLLAGTGLLNDRAMYGNMNFSSLALNYLRLDKASVNALNVFPTEKADERKNTNIFGFLNKCRSTIGQRRLKVWLRQPLVDRGVIKDRHDAVGFLLSKDGLRTRLQTAIAAVPDFAKYLASMAKGEKSGNFGNFRLEELHKLYEVIVGFSGFFAASEIRQDLEIAPANFRSLMEKLHGVVEMFGGFMQLFEQSVDLDEVRKGRYVIARSFDAKSAEIATERDAIDAEMEKVRGKLARKAGIDNVKVSDAQTPFNFALRVPKKAQSDAQKIPGVKQVQVNKAEYLFTTEEFQTMADELVDVNERFSKASEKVLLKVLQVAATYAPAIADLADVVADLDVLAAFALVAGMHRLARPEISAFMSLKNARHVLVESRLMESGSAAYVPNDVEISGDHSLVVITGPNMAGKSTWLRSSGLCVLLNQIGSFVPCDVGSRLPVYTAIYSRVGASDEQLRGVSTFMQEMIETSVILKMADERSLVLVDELGRGTNTLEGLGIAWAVAEELKAKRVACLFATHFVEIAQVPGAVNLHAGAVFDQNSIIFTYKIKPGVAQHSYGTHVARLAGYPAKVVDDANNRLSSLINRA